MFSLLSFGIACLASFARAQRDLGCASSSPSMTVSPNTISSCTLFYTPSMPPQIGPTSTVYATMMTTQFKVINCKYCHISNVAENPMPSGPFTARITSDYLLITEIACIPSTSATTRPRALPEATAEPTALIVRGARPQNFVPGIKQHVPLAKLVDHVKRQSPMSPAGSLPVLVQQLFTVIYSIGVINSGTDLGETCLQLQSANAVLDLAQVSLNATQASIIVCAASSPDFRLAAFNQTVVATAAAGLYGIQLVASFKGTIDTRTLCDQLDLSPLAAFGVNVSAIRTFVCGSENATSIETSISRPSLGTMTPFPITNSSLGSFSKTGTVTGTSSVSTAATAPWISGGPASGTGAHSISNLTSSAVNTGAGTGVSSTGSLPTATGNHVNGTTTHGTDGLAAATGNAGTGSAIHGTGSSSAGTGSAGAVTSVSATGGTAAGYAPSSVQPWSRLSEYGHDTSERLPYGPTSTPSYYSKYF